METANTPFTFKTADGVYGSIHEAALYDFSEMTLTQIGDYTLKAELTPWPDGIKVRKSNHFTTSWRTIQKAMEVNRVELNQQLPNYCQISKIKIHFEEFEKTAKKSIKRFMYQEAKG